MSTSSKITTLKKPRIGDALAFAEGGKPTSKDAARSEKAPAGLKSGLVPAGDVRLTANIRSDLHIKLKVRAAQESTTVGELIEQWIEGWG
jgi:hypothetical protein